MKVALVSAGSPDYAELAAVTQPTRDAYAKRHGYVSLFFECAKEDGDACKRMAYEELWGRGFDLFVWADLDSVVMNSAIRVEDIVSQWMPPDVHFLWGTDWAGPNSGVYIARFSPEGAHWMDRAYNTMLESGWADETAMEILATTYPFKDYVRAIPGRVLNAYDYRLYGWERLGIEYANKINRYEAGCWMLHMPGYPNEVRIPELKRRLLEAT